MAVSRRARLGLVAVVALAVFGCRNHVPLPTTRQDTTASTPPAVVPTRLSNAAILAKVSSPNKSNAGGSETKAAPPVAIVSRAILEGEPASQTAPPTPQPPAYRPISSSDPLPPPPLADELTKPAATHERGILVCEPVPAAGVAWETADFAAGCGDYLCLQVGGQPQLGQTPMLSSVSRALAELKLTNGCRLSKSDAIRVAKNVGATDAAVATVSPAQISGEIRISYSLYDAASGDKAGTSETIEGTPEKILAGLPGLADSLERALGVATPGNAAAVGLTTAQATSLGRLFWAAKFTSTDRSVVDLAADKSAPALICRLSDERYSNTAKFSADARLLLTKLAKSNCLAWAHAATLNPAAMGDAAAGLASLRKAYPGNCALADADVMIHRGGGGVSGSEQRAAVDAVRDAPKSPEAWLILGRTVSTESDSVRRGRLFSALGDGEAKTVRALYGLWEICEKRAADLDPTSDIAWLRLFEVLTATGRHDAARAAFAKAEELDRDKVETFRTGLLLFQKKWGGTAEDLNDIAQVAVMFEYAEPHDAARVARALREAGLDAQADQLTARYVSQVNAVLQIDSGDLAAYWDKADLASNARDMKPACGEYKQVVLLAPDSVRAHYEYAQALDRAGALKEAIGEYRQVLRLDPENACAPGKLGLALKKQKDFAGAEKYLKRGVQRDPCSAESHYGLGEIDLINHKAADAAREFQTCLELGGPSPIVYAVLTQSLAAAQDLPAAIHWGSEGTAMYSYSEQMPPGYGEQVSALYTALAFAYQKSKNTAEADSMYQEAIGLNPANYVAMIELGSLYNETGRRPEARELWLRALGMPLPAGLATRVRRDLAAYPDPSPQQETL